MVRRVIIGVHGLSNKPPQDTLKEWWWKSITDGVHFYRGGKGIPSFEARHEILSEADFDLVYWAALMYPKPVSVDSDRQPYVEIDEAPPVGRPRWLDKVEGWAGSITRGTHGVAAPHLQLWDDVRKLWNRLGLRGPLSQLVEDKLRDLVKYWEEAGGSIRECFQGVLLRHIERQRDSDMLVVAHSMGSIVAYDAINDWAESPLEERPLTLITIGSPLGIPRVREKLRPPPGMTPATFPSSRIKAWFNFADPQDLVADLAHLAPYFKDRNREKRIVDTFVANDFRDLDGKKNAHKSFGYLRCPEVAAVIDGFFSAQASNVSSH